MDQGFFHPQRGYWQAIGGTSAAIRAAYPDGTIEVPLKPGAIDGIRLAATTGDFDGVSGIVNVLHNG